MLEGRRGLLEGGNPPAALTMMVWMKHPSQEGKGFSGKRTQTARPQRRVSKKEVALDSLVVRIKPASVSLRVWKKF